VEADLLRILTTIASAILSTRAHNAELRVAAVAVPCATLRWHSRSVVARPGRGSRLSNPWPADLCRRARDTAHDHPVHHGARVTAAAAATRPATAPAAMS
jgi:hypothetical protein